MNDWLEKRMEFIEWIQKLPLEQEDKIDIIKESSIYHKHYAEKMYKRFLKQSKHKKKTYLYITLSPDKFLRNIECTKENLEEMDRWANNWFKYNKKHYGDDWCYVVEVGSKGDHGHLHCLVELKNSHKHAEQLKNSWKKVFPNNQLLTTKNLGIKNNSRGEYAYRRIDREDILRDTLDYFIEERKGTHSNLYDTGLRGSGGSFKDVIQNPE